MRERLQLIVALGLGCIALAWGLFYMHGIFIDERDVALESLAQRQRALEQYAHQELSNRLKAQLDELRPTIDAAGADPLIVAEKMWLSDRGQQVLPRTAAPRAGSDTPAKQLFDELFGPMSGSLLERARHDDPDGPWTERLSLLDELKAALRSGDRAGIEAGVREILSHRAAYVISASLDVPYTVAMLMLLQQQSTPTPTLMEALLRTGLSGQTQRLEGLQRTLLRNRPRFTEGDMRFLAARVVELCEPHNVLYLDFQARAAEGPGPVLVLPDEGLSEPALIRGWYVEPPREGRVYGLEVNVPAVLEEITQAMHARALLGDADRVTRVGDEPVLGLSKLEIDIASPSWQPAIDEIEGRYRLKALLEVIIALLAFGVMGLAVWIYQRRHRFLELKSDFVSAVSHELRTPLASIRLMAETLERRTKDLPKARDYPTRIIRDVDGLAFLVENILSFNRLSRGRWVPKKQAMNLATIVDKLDRDRDAWTRQKNAELSWEGVDQPLEADPDLLQLLLTNLVRNACSYNERDPCRVHIAAAREVDRVMVRVRDNGIGIPPSETERIFDDFYRSGAAKSGGERGSGLGLSICRKIMEAHGGSIRVADTGPDGTTFELAFPPAQSISRR